ncbi:hypothetical protein DPMN_045939 [Dreissena polymorpha]|uniref:Uncharacterized protein n=1 Tax=Dreissena polymorpha TaxID=45954 RepID=A0A9D4D6X1_DREPO|nr:hypothetical protein DPMN_045939 [Dreissena polymorpha]
MGEGEPPAGGRMTPDGESQCQLEAIMPKTIISTRITTTIGTWNVRTMYETGKTSVRIDEEVQPHHPRDQLIKMNWLCAEATDFR